MKYIKRDKRDSLIKRAWKLVEDGYMDYWSWMHFVDSYNSAKVIDPEIIGYMSEYISYWEEKLYGVVNG